MIWHCGQYDFDTSTPLIMGILNVTPDSFSDGGAYLDPEAAVEHGLDMVRAIENGPRTLDIDILDYQMYVASDDELTLPHPRVTERDFVVKPVLEILPGWELADGTPVGRVPEAERVGKARRI